MKQINKDTFIRLIEESNNDFETFVRNIHKINPKLEKHKIKQRLKRYILKGYIPLESGNKVLNGEQLLGTSTLYDANGNIKLQWVKSKADISILDSIENAINSMSDEITSIPEVPKSQVQYKDLLVKIPIADAHIGLLTWFKEVNEDFDLKIAKELYIHAFTQLLQITPSADTCLILELGDLLHSNDQSNQTPRSKNQLDIDGRFDKLFDMALFICYTMIDMSLQKFNHVIFRKTRGNHDETASIGISAALEMRYANNPRVKIERSPNLFWYYKFGKTLHFSTHGHTVRNPKDLAEIAAADCKKEWSDSDFVYIDYGHLHHKTVEETRTASIECHNTLTPADAFNFNSGYRAKRNIKSIIYHKEYGEITRSIVPIKLLNDTKDK